MPDAEDFVSPEVGIAVALTTAVLHPQVRKTVRRGLVLGVAGALSVGEGIKRWASGFNPAPVVNNALQDLEQEAQATRGKGKSVRKPGGAP